MKKRYVTSLFSILMVLSLVLAACSKDSGNAGNASSSADAGSTPSAAASSSETAAASDSGLQPYHLVMIFPGTAPKDLPLVQEEMNKYLQEKINATIEIRPIDWGAWGNKTNLMFASNEQFDVMFTSSWLGLGQQVAKGQIIPLDDLLNQYGQGIKDVIDPAVVQGGKIDGKIYGVVTNKEFAATKGIILRKDLVDKYNIDVSKIKELKDFDPIFQMIKEKEPGVVPLQVKADHSPLTEILGYGLFDMLGDGPGVLDRSSKELKVINMFETPVYMEYAKQMHKWFEAGYINKDAATNTDSEFNAVKAGKAFAYAMSMKPGIENQEARNTGVPMVAVELDKPYMTTGDTTSAMFAIPTTSKDPARAMMFLNLLHTDKYLINLLNWGIEDKHYKKVSDNVIDYADGVDAKTTGYGMNQSWMFGNQLNTYLWTTEDPQLWDKYKTFNETAEKSLALGFVFNPEKIKNEITAINNAAKQYNAAIVTGARDPEKTIPEFVNKLKSAGIDKVIADKQRQLDEWAAANKK